MILYITINELYSRVILIYIFCYFVTYLTVVSCALPPHAQWDLTGEHTDVTYNTSVTLTCDVGYRLMIQKSRDLNKAPSPLNTTQLSVNCTISGTLSQDISCQGQPSSLSSPVACNYVRL